MPRIPAPREPWARMARTPGSATAQVADRKRVPPSTDPQLFQRAMHPVCGWRRETGLESRQRTQPGSRFPAPCPSLAPALLSPRNPLVCLPDPGNWRPVWWQLKAPSPEPGGGELWLPLRLRTGWGTLGRERKDKPLLNRLPERHRLTASAIPRDQTNQKAQSESGR